MIVYTDDTNGYNQKRNFAALPFDKVVLEEKFNFFKIPNALYFKFFNRSNKLFLFSHAAITNTKSVFHFFNTVNLTRQPWIVSFETSLPRWGKIPKWLEKKGVELLAKDNCKKIIAISRCSYAIHKHFLSSYPKLMDSIMSKTMVLHPAQRLLINSYADKNLNPEFIEFTFVGADFFRKGGKEVLAVFDKLLDSNAPIKLNIVSSLNYGDYASKATLQDKEQALQIIRKHSDRITLFAKLSNAEVLELLIKSHVGLLPTYADTYGYAVLEAQAAGCPVITTNIRALPEINNDNCGWVIDVPKNSLGNGLLDSEHERTLFSSILKNELSIILTAICNTPGLIERKGTAAFQRIKEEHNPEVNAAILTQLYTQL